MQKSYKWNIDSYNAHNKYLAILKLTEQLKILLSSVKAVFNFNLIH